MSSSKASSKALDHSPDRGDIQSEGTVRTGYPTPPSSRTGDFTGLLGTTEGGERNAEDGDLVSSRSDSGDTDDGDKESEEGSRDSQEQQHPHGDTDSSDKRDTRTPHTASSRMPGCFDNERAEQLLALVREGQNTEDADVRESEQTTDEHAAPTVSEDGPPTVTQVGSTLGSITDTIRCWAYNKLYSASGPVKSLIDASNWYTNASGFKKSAIKATAITMAGMAALRLSVNTAADTKRCLDEWSRPYGYMSCFSGSERLGGMIEPWWVLKGRDDWGTIGETR